jgi:transcription antitermination factor NusG
MKKRRQLRRGQIVQVVRGPLAGFRAKVKEITEQTVTVVVHANGRDTPMDLTLGQIELVPENSN